MALKIDQEANQLRKSISDIDRFRRRYAIREQDDESNTDININFISPSIVVWEKNRFYLLKHSSTKPLEPKHYYRPDYVSYNEYGSTIYWNMIMFINNIPTIEEFNKKNILIPSLDSIISISRSALANNAPEQIVPLTKAPNVEIAKLYQTKRYAESRTSDPNLVPIDRTFHFYREQNTVTSVMQAYQYIDLDYEPIEDSVVVRIAGNESYLINRDYTLVKSICKDGKRQRISWNSVKFPNLSGRLLSDISPGTIIEVQYSREVDGISEQIESSA